jgi:hypothetical protein
MSQWSFSSSSKCDWRCRVKPRLWIEVERSPAMIPIYLILSDYPSPYRSLVIQMETQTYGNTRLRREVPELAHDGAVDVGEGREDEPDMAVLLRGLSHRRCKLAKF